MNHPILPSPWKPVPFSMRSIVRAYINGEQPADKERAQALCREYGLDYDAMRAMIHAEMVAYTSEKQAPKKSDDFPF